MAFDEETGAIWLAQVPARNIVVLQTKDNTVRQVIEGIEAPSAIAFSEHYAFVSDAMNNVAAVIGKRSLELATMLKPVGRRPNGVYFEPKHGTVWVGTASGDFTIFKAVGRGGFKRLAGLRLRPGPSAEPVGAGVYVAAKNRIYQPVDDMIEVIVPTNRKIERVWKTGIGGRLTSLAFDTKSERLIGGGTGKTVVLIDTRNGRVLGKTNVAGEIGDVAVDTALRRAYVADSAGRIDVVGLDRGKLIKSVPSDAGIMALAVDPRSHLVYVYRDRANKVDVLAIE